MNVADRRKVIARLTCTALDLVDDIASTTSTRNADSSRPSRYVRETDSSERTSFNREHHDVESANHARHADVTM